MQAGMVLIAALCLAGANWGARDYNSIKHSAQPICVFIHDNKPKSNHVADLFSSKDCLNNDQAIPKLAKFQCIKIKADGSDSKGWPADLLKQAENGAVIVVFSSDLKRTATACDKSTTKHEVKAALLVALDSIQKYEDALKEEAASQQKEAAAARAAKAKADAAEAKEKNVASNSVPGVETRVNKQDKPKSKKEVDD